MAREECIHYRFHDPNPAAEIAGHLLRLLAAANAAPVRETKFVGEAAGKTARTCQRWIFECFLIFETQAG